MRPTPMFPFGRRAMFAWSHCPKYLLPGNGEDCPTSEWFCLHPFWLHNPITLHNSHRLSPPHWEKYDRSFLSSQPKCLPLSAFPPSFNNVPQSLLCSLRAVLISAMGRDTAENEAKSVDEKADLTFGPAFWLKSLKLIVTWSVGGGSGLPL